MISVRFEDRAAVSLGKNAGTGGVIHVDAERVRVRLFDLEWTSLRREPNELNHRDVSLPWARFAGVEVSTGPRGPRIRFTAAELGALDELPGAEATGWSVRAAPGQDLELLELVAEMELRIAEEGRA